MSENKLLILRPNHKLELSRDWNFTIRNKHGNLKFLRQYVNTIISPDKKLSDAKVKKYFNTEITLEKGTILNVIKIDSWDLVFEITNTIMKNSVLRLGCYGGCEEGNKIYYVDDDVDDDISS